MRNLITGFLLLCFVVSNANANALTQFCNTMKVTHYICALKAKNLQLAAIGEKKYKEWMADFQSKCRDENSLTQTNASTKIIYQKAINENPKYASDIKDVYAFFRGKQRLLISLIFSGTERQIQIAENQDEALIDEKCERLKLNIDE